MAKRTAPRKKKAPSTRRSRTAGALSATTGRGACGKDMTPDVLPVADALG
jgi:hypothetical protein